MTPPGSSPTPETLVPLWTFENPYGPLSGGQSLVVAGDRLIGSSGSTVFAVDLYTGTPVTPSDEVKAQGFPYSMQALFGSEPHITAVGGLVYFMDGDTLVALQLADGQPLPGWQPPTLRQVSSLFAVGGEVVAVHVHPTSGAALVSGFVAVSGKRSFGPVQISTQSPGRVAYGHGAVFFVSGARLNAVNVDFGDTRWQYGNNLGGPLDLSVAPAVTKDLVLAASGLLHAVDLATGAVVAPYALPGLGAGQVPAVGNDTVFIPAADGSIVARSFAKQVAAYFDGLRSRIDVQPDGDQFDFGLGDFTVEAWVKSSEGGEIVSSYPTAGGDHDHGFRLNMTQRGEIRVAAVNSTLEKVHAGETDPTHAADGEWHHVALIRRGGSFVVLVDGLSLPVFLRDDSDDGLAIGGCTALTIGAYVANRTTPPEEHFCGLIRELRIWDRALDVATVQANLQVELTGQEPRLKGLWRLDEVQMPGQTPVEPANAVQRHRNPATFVNAASAPTDLTMDKSAFPYLLHEVQLQWPYAGTWAARGEEPITTAAALSASGALAFGTNNALYAVRKHDGHRLLSLDVAEGASAPAADGSFFFAVTGEESLIAIDALTGRSQQVSAFTGLVQSRSGPFAAPAVTPRYLAAGSPTGLVAVLDRTAAAPGQVVKAPVPGAPVSLLFGPSHLFVLTGPPASRQLAVVDPATGDVRGTLPVASDAFCVAGAWLVCVQGNTIVRIDPAGAGLRPARASQPLGASVTGLAAWPDSDLLVATTSQGTVYGLSLATLAMRWQRSIPAGPAAGVNAVNAPAFDEAGRLYAGTAYFGGAEPTDPQAYCDGALHSVVFGDTVALRLGLDALGKPAGATYALVDAEKDDCTLHLMDVTQSCVEAWVSIPPGAPGAPGQGGGGVLGVCPTDAGGFDLNLWIDPDGTIHYAARAKETDGWTGIHAQAASGVCDGKWHHVAVARDGEDHLVMYVDGQALADVQESVVADPPAKTVPGLKAFIGATAAPDLGADKPFRGLIGEVRVWDTYLVSTEIVSRMHVKLRGDEPDLLAYWNFDRQAVHDSARQGHDGVLVNAGAAPAWWLTDLPFTMPSYPYVEAAAAITQEGEAGTQGPLGDTVYRLTLTVRRADGAGLPGHPVDLRYVAHDETEPATIVVGDATLTAGAPASCLTVTTGPDGSVTVPVRTPLVIHGPSIDVRAGFMPANERFHVNVLLDNQKLEKPSPPTLTAQAKLIQDYHYTTGNQINEDRDRSTWRVVLRAANADQTCRGGEPITLWAAAPTQIEGSSTAYPINADNSVTLTADANGELAVVLEAADLAAPTLYARAGFMHRNDRIVIAPDQDAHSQLAGVQSADLTKPKLTNGKPNATDADKKPLLGGDYAPHAGEVADAVRHVMSAATPSAGMPPSGGSSTALGSGAGERAPFEDMRQPMRARVGDSVVLLRTLSGTPRRAPVNPDALRASLNGSLGFVFEAAGPAGGFRYQTLATQAEVDRERGTPTPVSSALGGLFGSIWSGIKHVATSAYEGAKTVYEGAKKVVVTVADTISVAVHKVVEGVATIVHVVVHSIEEAAAAVANFFKQIGLAIWQVIQFLRELFDWGEILRTHRILKATMKACARRVAGDLKNGTLVRQALAPLAHVLGLSIPASSAGSLTDLGHSAPGDSPVAAHLDSVKGNMMRQKAQEQPATKVGDPGAGPAVPAVPSGRDAIDAIVDDLRSLVADVVTTPLPEIVSRLLATFKKLGQDVFDALIEGLVVVAGLIADGIDAVVRVLDAAIHIPFISALYKWITGDDLSLLDLLALILAIPVNIVYGIMTTITTGSIKHFADDNAGLPDWVAGATPAPVRLAKVAGAPAATVGSGIALGAGAVAAPTKLGVEIAYVVLRLTFTVFNVLTDVAFAENVTAREDIGADRNSLKIMKGLTGIAASTLLFALCNPPVADAFDKAAEARGVDFDPDSIFGEHAERFFFWQNLTIYILSLVGDVITLGGGVYGWCTEVVPPGPLAIGRTDKDEYRVLRAVALAAALFMVYSIVTWIAFGVSKPFQTLQGTPIATEVMLLRARNLFYLVPRLFAWMYTATAAMRPVPPDYEAVGMVRSAANGWGLWMHGIGVFAFGTKST